MYGNRVSPSGLILLLLLYAGFMTGAASAAGRTWTPVDQAPAARIESGLILLPCVFTPLNDRCAWDGPCPEISQANRLELVLTVDKPARLRSLTLYLRSGEGWYAAPFSLPSTPGTPISLSRGDFIEEGKPAGWDKIEGLRLAAWKKETGDCQLTLHSISALQDRVFILRADDSAPAGERAVAEILARRVSLWLNKAGIGHALLGEKDWLALPPAQSRFVILPFNPRPPAPLFKALATVVKKGGKLLVCYGADPQLAALMGFRLAPYSAAPTPMTWSAYAFNPPLGPVSNVFQESQHLIPAFPDKPDTRVLAWWENAAGSPQPEPAWLAGPAGYWMTHTLESDDALRKTRVLLEWIGEAAPEAWEQAGRFALKQVESASGSPWKEGLALQSKKDWKALVDLSLKWEQQAVREKADRLPKASTGAVASVWAHPGSGWTRSNGKQTALALKEAGIRRVFLSALSFGRSHANSDLWASSELAAVVSDPFGNAFKEAREAGLSVHAWITCFQVSQAPAARLSAWRLAGRLMVTAQGEQPWLTPTHPDNAALLLNHIEELARRYPVDGLHLDYIRYPDAGLDISPSARAGYEKKTGPVETWPADVLPGGPRHEAYKTWLIETLNTLVLAARDRLRQVRPGCQLTAAVYPAYPYCREGVLQDWKTWLETGSVDAVCPMSYTASLDEFNSLIAAYQKMPAWGTRIFPAIGVITDTVPLPGRMAVDQVAAVNRAGGSGVVFFLATREFMRDYLPAVTAPFR